MAAALPSELDIVEGHVLHGWAEGIPGMYAKLIHSLSIFFHTLTSSSD